MWEEKNKPIRHPGLDPGPLSASAWPAARDPGFRRDDEETETLHPHIRPFGHRVTLTIAPAKETHRQCSAQTGNDPGRCAPLGGFGWGVKGGSWTHPTSATVAPSGAPQRRVCHCSGGAAAARPTGRRALWRVSQASADALRPAPEGENKQTRGATAPRVRHPGEGRGLGCLLSDGGLEWGSERWVKPHNLYDYDRINPVHKPVRRMLLHCLQ